MNVKSEPLKIGESKLINSLQDSSLSIAREKVALGAAYGAVAGIAFAIALWAWDAIQLNQAHAFFPWLKLIAGILLCGIVGGSAGWLVARKDSGLISFVIWLFTAAVISWITVAVPIQIFSLISKWIDPDLSGLINYVIGSGFVTRFWLAMLWVGIFLSLTGLLQLTLVESAVFTNSLFGKIAPFLICTILMGIAGFVIDDLVNVPMRKAIMSVDTPIQFILDHRGQDFDPAEGRTNHVGSLHGVLDSVSATRRLIVSSFKDDFAMIEVLVRFDDAWVTCTTVNSQSSYCKYVEANP